MRTLLAGFGNVLRGDDGFGVEVVRRLAERPPAGDVELMEVGTAGIRLAQQLLDHYDRLIVVDAMEGGGPPGTVYVRKVEDVAAVTEVDMHMAVPSRALALARALGAMPRQVFFVGCQPVELDELTTELSPPVRNAVDRAVHAIRTLVAEGNGRG